MKVKATVVIDVAVEEWRSDEPELWDGVSDLNVAMDAVFDSAGAAFDNYLLIDEIIEVVPMTEVQS